MSGDSANRDAGRPTRLSAQIDAAGDRFEAAWLAGKQPRIEDYLSAAPEAEDPDASRRLLLELVMIDLEWRWRSPPSETVSSKLSSEATGGITTEYFPSRLRLEDYVERYPSLGPLDQLPADLIVTEYDTRHRWGDHPSHAEYLERFPGQADALPKLLAGVDEALAAEVTRPRQARTGDSSTSRLSASITLDQFIQNLNSSGLMTAEAISQFQESLPPDKRPSDGQTLARQLVEADKLTGYQADQICRGDTKVLAFGEYIVVDQIGAGGMGQVLKAKHRTMRRLVALKIISPKLVDSPEAVKRFHREVRAAAKLIHPNIVTAFDASDHRGMHYMAMEYVEGQDLGKVIKERGPLPVEEAVNYVIQAARGLQYAHERGIVHRDIKPGNLLLQSPHSLQGAGVGSEGAKPIVKILDMGLARLDEGGAAEDEPDSDHLTGSSQMMGTCDYMAPEQAVDTHGVDHRADIYSLGCTLYRMLAGKRPYTGTTPIQVLMAHREAPIPSICEARDDVRPELDAVFRKMVAKEPEDRQQSMTEVIEELGTCVVDDDEDRPSDRALDAFLHDVSHGGSGAGLTKATDSKTTVEGEAEEATTPSAHAVPLARRLKPLWAIGGPVLALALLTGLLVVLVGGPKMTQLTSGTLVVRGPLGEVEVTAKHDGDDFYRPLELDEEGCVELEPGEYRIGLLRGHEQYQVEPDRITVTGEQQVAVRIERKDSVVAKSGTPAAQQTGWQPGPAEDVLPGLIPRPAQLPGVKRWQVVTRTPTGFYSVSFSPDSQVVAVDTQAGPTVRIYSVPDLSLLRILPTSGAIAWSPDQKWIAIASPGLTEGNTVPLLWSAETGKPALQRWTVPASVQRRYWDLAWHPEGSALAVTTFDSNLWVLDPSLQEAWSGNVKWPRSVDWSPDGKWIAVGGGAGDSERLVVFDSQKQKQEIALEPGFGRCTTAFSPDGRLLAAGGNAENGVARVPVWDTDSWEVARELIDDSSNTRSGRVGEIEALAWSPDSRYLMVARGQSKSMVIWDMTTGEPARKLDVPAVRKIDWSQDGKWIVACRETNELVLLDTEEWKPIKTLVHTKLEKEEEAGILTLKFSDDKEAAFSDAGDLLSNNAAELDDELVYLVEQDDGSVELLKPTKFLARFATPPAHYALEFDGKTSGVDLPNLGLDGTSPLTLEAWGVPSKKGKIGGHHGYRYMLQCANSHGGIHLGVSDGQEFQFLYDDGEGWEDRFPTGATCTRGQPFHVALVFDGRQLVLYRDGEHAFSRAVPGGRIDIWSDANYAIGTNPASTHRGWLGTIDEVRISSIARYDKDFTPQVRFEPDEHTMALYHFDEGQGDVLHDSSGNGHHGKIVGAKWVKVGLATPESP